MQIKDVMSQKPDVLASQATIREAALHMRDYQNGLVPIYRDNKLIGMVTDRDITVRGIAEGKSPDDSVSAIMTDEVLYCFEDDDVENVLKNMQENQVQRLVVLDNPERKDLVGVVSVADIADNCEDEKTSRAIVDCCRHYH